LRLLGTSREFAVELVEVPWCPLDEISVGNNKPSSWHCIYLKGDKRSLLLRIIEHNGSVRICITAKCLLRAAGPAK